MFSLRRARGGKVLCSLSGEPGVVRCCDLSQENPGCKVLFSLKGEPGL